MEKQRKSNFELMRIVLTIMIIILHYLGNTGALTDYQNLNNINYYIANILESLCIIAVNCFIVITGYFMYDKKKINIRKIVNILTIATVYNIVLYITTILLGVNYFSIKSIKTFVITQFSFLGWFVPIYTVLYLLIPYINKLIETINKKQFKTLLIILLICFSIYPTFLSDVTVKDYGYGIINFIILYLIGAYTKIYFQSKDITKQKTFLIYLICTICTFIFSLFSQKAYYYNTIFNIIGAVSFVMFFSKINIKSKIINKLAIYTLGIYLLHNNIWVNNIIWNFFGKGYHTTNIFIQHLIICVINIYLICLIIEIMRKMVFDNTIYKLFDKIKKFNKEIEVK